METKMTELFYPHVGYALGDPNDADTIWTPWEQLTALDIKAALEGIEDAKHRRIFETFAVECRSDLLAGKTLGECFKARTGG